MNLFKTREMKSISSNAAAFQLVELYFQLKSQAGHQLSFPLNFPSNFRLAPH